MTKLYLIRHGETEENIKGSFCGWLDVSLSPTGVLQAKMLGEALKRTEIDAIYTSGLKRTKETAEYIRGNNSYPVYHMENFRELNFGLAEGLTIEEIKKCHPELYEGLEKDYVKTKFPKGENLEEMHLRVTTAIDEILRDQENKNILLVAHSGVIRSIVAHLITGDIKYHWNFKIDHCSITVVENSEKFSILTRLNDTCHLSITKEGRKEK